MDAKHVASELGLLIDELDAGLGFVLRERGLRLAADLDRHLRPMESLVDELFFDERCDERSVREVRQALDAMRALCLHLPATIESTVDRSACDRLRALRIDLDLGLLGEQCAASS